MDGNTGTHQCNMKYTKIFKCSNKISTIKILTYQRHLLLRFTCGKTEMIIILWMTGGYHRALWIEINENRLLGFRKHDIIPSTAWNLCLVDPRTVWMFNDTLQTSFFKHEIYHKIHYIHVQYSYPIPTHLAQDFEKLDELINHLMHTSDKNV